MKIKPSILDSLNIISTKQAKEIQLKLSGKVITSNNLSKINIVSGIDISLLKNDKKLICGIVSFKYPELEVVESIYNVCNETFPYVPGLLSFREGPAILETLVKLKSKPDLLIFDGQGIAHPRGFGIASHIGVVLNMSTMGIAKKKLYGNYKEPENVSGDYTYLIHPDNNSRIGAVLRTKNNVKPVFISIGHKIDLEKAIEVSMNCNRGFRIPEPTRQAHLYVTKLRKYYKYE